METLQKPAQAAGGPDYAQRLDRLRDKMSEHGVDYVFVGPSADLFYLTGLNLHSSERLAVLVVAKDGPARIVVPSFEVSGLAALPAGIETVAWQEVEAPTKVIGGLLGGG